MREYQIVYAGPYGQVTRNVEASDHTVARRLGSKFIANRMGYCDLDKVAVIDIDMAGRGKHTGHCQGCKPDEMCSRSGTCGWADERHAMLDHLCVCAGGPGNCTCKSSERADRIGESVWARIQQEELDKVHAIWSRRAGDAR